AGPRPTPASRAAMARTTVSASAPGAAARTTISARAASTTISAARAGGGEHAALRAAPYHEAQIVAGMSEAKSGTVLTASNPAYRCAHVGDMRASDQSASSPRMKSAIVLTTLSSMPA